MRELEQDVLQMASRAEAMVTKAIASLQSLETSAAYEVMDDDDELDVQELYVEQRCLKLLSDHQSDESELREIGTVIRLITDLERIGDLAVDVAKITLKVEKELGATDYVDIPMMANVACKMLRMAIQMFVKKSDADLEEVSCLEEQVDSLYRDIRGQIFAYMIQNPDKVVPAGWMLYAIHHVERIADHSLNIAERVSFMVTGKPAAHPRGIR
ncbi:MAG: phosphate signaling complex protein PhoU [Fimbriimonadaceae bacterium]|nr:phosphate signaling complex protein PhoU [Fimbriimonadaceae bacterium]QYK54997.1 MAG: phosphate signaling complex protein PhoU [Fimbriimonadaceae bacterium]